MSRLFKRNTRITIYSMNPADGQFFDKTSNGIVVEKLRCQFTISKSLEKDPNTCDITITNLAPQSRALMNRRPLACVLEAGFDGEYRVLFQGDVVWSVNEPKGTEWLTKLQLGDGARAFSRARVSQSFAAGTTVFAAVRSVAKSMGLTVPPLAASEGLEQQFSAGLALSGKSRDELSRLLEPLKMTWSVQGGRLQILREEDVSANTSFEISERTGMIESPETGTPKKDGKPPVITVKMELFPQLQPGQTVTIKSRDKNGTFKIESVKHAGDSMEGDYQTQVEVKLL